MRGIVVEEGRSTPARWSRRGQPLLAIVQLDDVWVTANFKETQLTEMRAGQRATVDVDAYGGKEFKGKVDSIAAATGARFSLLPPENATGNFVKVVQRVPVKIVLDPGQDPEHLLRPGMSVDADGVSEIAQCRRADCRIAERQGEGLDPSVPAIRSCNPAMS